MVQQLPMGEYQQSDEQNLIDTIDDNSLNKILIAARSTKIVRLVSQANFCIQLRERGYNWMYITSKTGAIINGMKVSVSSSSRPFNQWGQDDTRFVILHHSILSEGINVKGLEDGWLKRNMDYIESVNQSGV